MSLDREYETSKIGVTVAFTLAASGKALVRLCDFSSVKRKRSFAVRVSTAAGVRAKQGGKTVTSSDTAADADLGLLLTNGFRWRVDVDTDQDAFVALLNPSGQAAVTIEITRVSDTGDDDPPVAV